VSPQFHVKTDDFFETVRTDSLGYDSPDPSWIDLSGLRKPNVSAPKPAYAATESSPPRLLPGPAPGDNVAPPAPPEHPDVDILPAPPADEPSPALPIPDEVLSSDPPPAPPLPHRTTRSGRIVRDTQRYTEGMQLRNMDLVAWEVLLGQDDQTLLHAANQKYALQHAMDNPLAFAASSDPEVLHHHEAMRADDREHFVAAMHKELSDHETNQHFIPVLKRNVPNGTHIIDMVWSMRRKRRLDTGEVYKWKSRLNVHGGQQEYGVNYWFTYSPVVHWQTLRMMFILSILKGWYNRQVDFVLAFPQAPVEVEQNIFLNFPKGYIFRNGVTKETHVLELKKNIYGTKQAGRVWNRYLEQGLKEIGFRPSAVDPVPLLQEKCPFPRLHRRLRTIQSGPIAH
jgi:hypothetical protein